MITYQLSVKVKKKTAYLINEGRKLVIPELLTINRTEHGTYDDSSLGQKAINNMGLERIDEDLEGYRDTALGTIVFNKTMVPKTSCDKFRSVAKITDGSLYRSKLGEFSIYKYIRDEESVAVTLNQQQRSCGRRLYQTGIPNIHILVLEGKEDF